MLMNRRALLIVLLGTALAAAAACSSCRRSQPIADAVYREAVPAFFSGLAALETSQDSLALQKLGRVTELVPGEAAAWANIGLIYLRHHDPDNAVLNLETAARLAPGNGEILHLQALAESRRGRPAEAIRFWRRALETNAGDLRSAFALAQELEREGRPEGEAEAQRILDGLLRRSDNLAARLELARLTAKRGDRTALLGAIAPLATQASQWPPDVQERLRHLQAAAASSDPRAAAVPAVFLKNLLLAVPAYRIALARVSTSETEVGRPIERLMAMENPAPRPAAPDESLRFSIAPADAADTRNAVSVNPVWLRPDGAPTLAIAGTDGLRIAGLSSLPRRSLREGGPRRSLGEGAPPRSAAEIGPVTTVVPADLNFDFLTDLVVLGPQGIQLLRQNKPGGFTDVTSAAKLPPAITSSQPAGLWPADVDLDGDLDLVVAATDSAPFVLRNNTDGTFAIQAPFAGVVAVRGFAWADFDGEGTPDAAFLDRTGAVRLFRNMRGSFEESTLPAGSQAVAIAAASLSDGSAFDVLLLDAAGSIARLSHDAITLGWTRGEVARVASEGLSIGGARMLLADLDNNAAADIVVSSASTFVLLGGTAGFASSQTIPGFDVHAIADVDADGRLELLGVAANRAVMATSRGSKNYHWQSLRPRALTTVGDQRINSFGIGGEVELRTGLHAQRQVVTAPAVHFGLGEAKQADVIRITWPNGVLQSEFDQPANAVINASQRLKGSCPWLFGWDGQAMSFVTDLIWRSPLGLRINAQATADVLMTEDRIRIPGDRLVPRDGAYDLRITAELWETHFFDHVALLVVDHPAGTEAFVDERFAIPAPSLDTIITGPLQPLASARDDLGRDVTHVVRARDDRHLDFAGRGAYQGITRDHFVEIELPDSAPSSGPLWLAAQGWIHPTDSSVNIAISQGAHAAPKPLSLSVADAGGRWRVVRANLGFPAGKDKTVMLDISGLFPAAGRRRLRLSTNLEIFWDRISWAQGRPDVKPSTTRVSLSGADLRFRGYSVIEQREPSIPERPVYRLAGTMARWLDLEGYHTRFGEVRELLTAVDDRYVIMNAGDELLMRFPEVPAPPSGYVRDFIVVADGWEKDGDYNTTFSRTVLPLPTHASGKYSTPPTRLQDDPVYRRHPRDFDRYHTRYVTPSGARDALRRTSGGER